MQMGRPRTARKDLPPGLHFDPRFGTFYYRATKGGKREFIALGKIPREAAIKRWVAITTAAKENDEAKAGTVGELIDRFVRDLEGCAPATRTNYLHHCGKLRERWGEREYARTADEAARRDVLRPLDVSAYLRDARAAGRGAESAVYAVGVLSMVFQHGQESGLTYFDPCKGVRRRPRGTPRKSEASKKLPTAAEIQAAMDRAGPRMRLMMDLDRRTGMRETDLLKLRESQDQGDVLVLVQNKTGMAQHWTITPEIRAILDAAKTLPGRARSPWLNSGDGYIFPQRSGKELTVYGFASDWRTVKAGFQFRKIRKWAINQRIAAGGNGSDFAGHHDPATTRLHYDVTPKKVVPL